MEDKYFFKNLITIIIHNECPQKILPVLHFAYKIVATPKPHLSSFKKHRNQWTSSDPTSPQQAYTCQNKSRTTPGALAKREGKKSRGEPRINEWARGGKADARAGAALACDMAAGDKFHAAPGPASYSPGKGGKPAFLR